MLAKGVYYAFKNSSICYEKNSFTATNSRHGNRVTDNSRGSIQYLYDGRSHWGIERDND